MAEIVVAHGAWSAGWAWKKMRPLMARAGHRLWTPTYTGVGERHHLARREIDLDTHINDLLAVIEYEDLRDVMLVAHSYGGMVGTSVADRARDRIAQLVYLDAFVPEDGQSLLSLLPDNGAAVCKAAQDAGDGWRVPPMPLPQDTAQDDVRWALARRREQPIATLSSPLRLQHGPLTLPRSYILCTRDPGFTRFDELARERGWRTHTIDATHNPHITVPEALAALLVEIAATTNVR